MGQALARFLDTETAARFCASRQAPSRDELQRLAADAGFSNVEVRVSRIGIHLPRLNQFALDHLAATPIASVMDAADATARKQIGESVMKQLQHYADGDGITYPEKTHVLTAQAW